MTSIGIVGFGTIGRAILNAVTSGYLPVGVAGVTSRSADEARAFLATLATPVGYLSRGAESGITTEVFLKALRDLGWIAHDSADRPL